MLQIAGLLLLSWALIWLFERGNLSVLGFAPTQKRLKYFVILFSVSAFFATSAFLLRMYFAKEEYEITASLTANKILLDVWYQIRTVLTEELLFRGILLYIVIKVIGHTKAIFISAVLFGAIHLLDAAAWGNINQMILVFSFTFSMGLLLAYAYAKSFSILIPFAIHFGWNLIQNYIFPDNAAGNHIFILSAPPPTVTVSYFSFFTMLFFPKIAVVVVDYLIIKNSRWVKF